MSYFECLYRSLAKKGPSIKYPPTPMFALISCKGLKFTLQSAKKIFTEDSSYKFISKSSRAFDVLIHSG